MERKKWRRGKSYGEFDHVVTYEEALTIPDVMYAARWAVGHKNDPRYEPRLVAMATIPTANPERAQARRESIQPDEITREEFFQWLPVIKTGLELWMDTSGVLRTRFIAANRPSNAMKIRMSRWDGIGSA